MGKKKKSRPRGKSGGGNQRHRSRPSNREQPIGQRETAGEGGGEATPGGGVLEMHPNGYGFLRDPDANYVRQLSDPFVPGSMIDKFGLREGVALTGLVQPGRKQQGPRLKEISDVDGMKPEDYRDVQDFRPTDADHSGELAQA